VPGTAAGAGAAAGLPAVPAHDLAVMVVAAAEVPAMQLTGPRRYGPFMFLTLVAPALNAAGEATDRSHPAQTAAVISLATATEHRDSKLPDIHAEQQDMCQTRVSPSSLVRRAYRRFTDANDGGAW
jgi:hypothetical protein